MSFSDQDLELFEQELREHSPAALSDHHLEALELSAFAGELASTAPVALNEDLLSATLHKITEAELQQVEPAQLETELLDTLELAPLEAELRALTPAPLNDSTMDRFLGAIDQAEQSIGENIITFPTQPAEPKHDWKWYSAAAAVAILGILIGTIYTPSQPSSAPLANNSPAMVAPAHQSNGDLINVSTNSTIIDAQDQGMVRNQQQGSPYVRAVKVVTMETFFVENAQGEAIEVKRPVEKIVFLPLSSD